MFRAQLFARCRGASHRLIRRAQSTAQSVPSTVPTRFANAGLLTGSFVVGWATCAAYSLLSSDSKTLPARSALKGDIPSIDTTQGYPFEFSPPLTPTQVTETLNGTTWSYPSTGVQGVARYDGAQVASNAQCEDRVTHGKFPSPLTPGKEWLAWGVFDGHLGALTAEALSHHLMPYVWKHLQGVPEQKINEAIKDAFLALDDLFINTVPETVTSSLPFAEKVSRLAQGTNGSCAILSLYDPASRTPRVACTGDSRAVLGRQSTTGWETVALSEDQSGSSPSEIARVEAQHPGEDEVVKKGRVLGLMCSRAFGDGRWKWPAKLLADVKSKFKGDIYKAYDEKYKTAPYITAEPVVTTTKLEEGQSAFMIVASDGLWDTMSSEQAVDLVGRWVAWRKATGNAPAGSVVKDFGTFDLGDVPYEGWKLDEKKITVQDDNAAVHLVRNALGGAHHDMISGVLTVKPPFSREIRDDITVQVVFFQ
jgi:pyruvate dehydrogenase phosphatase